jgi:hypothetical protein
MASSKPPCTEPYIRAVVWEPEAGNRPGYPV